MDPEEFRLQKLRSNDQPLQCVSFHFTSRITLSNETPNINEASFNHLGETGSRYRHYTSIYGNSLEISLTFELTMSLDCLRKGDIFSHLELGTRS